MFRTFSDWNPMAHKTLIVCDYDQTHEATEEVTVALDGAAVLLDLCEDDAATVRETVQDIIDRGRPIALKDMGKRGNGGTGEVDPAAVRSWALANGITVSDRGRVSEAVVQQWRNATQS
jgi:hypothetical protein